MEPNDLLTPEIQFELLSRGIAPKENQTLRRAQLRGALAKEREGIKYEFSGNFTFDIEAAELQNTLKSLLNLVSDNDHVFTNLEIRRAQSRLIHAQRRCSFLCPTTDLERETVDSLESYLLIISGFLIEIKDNSVADPVASSTMNLTNAPNLSVLPVYSKSPAINKWGIKFSGQSSTESVMSFLEKINELCEARNISTEDLFTASVDLFSGTALLWYRNIKKEVHCWSELVNCLKRDFLPVDYEDDLLSEIRSRTQGPSENVLFYIIAVEALFNRLTTPPIEKDIVKQIRRNLNPYFAEKLVMIETISLSDLKDKCRSIQELKTRNERYHPPPSKKQGLLEPDLACLNLNDIPTVSKAKSIVTQPVTVSSMLCWNCQHPGHSHRECTAARSLFCYKCGTKGYYSNSCINCLPKNEQAGIVPNLPVPSSSFAKSNLSGTIPVTLPASPLKNNPKATTSRSNPSTLQKAPLRAAKFVPHPDSVSPKDEPSSGENEK